MQRVHAPMDAAAYYVRTDGKKMGNPSIKYIVTTTSSSTQGTYGLQMATTQLIVRVEQPFVFLSGLIDILRIYLVAGSIITTQGKPNWPQKASSAASCYAAQAHRYNSIPKVDSISHYILVPDDMSSVIWTVTMIS